MTAKQVAAAIRRIPMYRGTKRGDPSEVPHGIGYFISSQTFAQTYGPTGTFRLDLRNPLLVDQDTWLNEFDSVMLRLDATPLEALAEDGYDSAVLVQDGPAGVMYTVLALRAQEVAEEEEDLEDRIWLEKIHQGTVLYGPPIMSLSAELTPDYYLRLSRTPQKSFVPYRLLFTVDVASFGTVEDLEELLLFMTPEGYWDTDDMDDTLNALVFAGIEIKKDIDGWIIDEKDEIVLSADYAADWLERV